MKLRIWRILVAGLFVICAAVVQAQEEKQGSAQEQKSESEQQPAVAQEQTKASEQELEEEPSFWDKSVTFGAEAWEATKEMTGSDEQPVEDEAARETPAGGI